MKLYEYKYRHVNIFKIFTVCVYLYIHKETQNTHTLCKQKLLLLVRLIAINHLTALLYISIILCTNGSICLWVCVCASATNLNVNIQGNHRVANQSYSMVL